RARVRAAAPGGDRADHRAADDGAARGRARGRRRAPLRRRARPDRRDRATRDERQPGGRGVHAAGSSRLGPPQVTTPLEAAPEGLAPGRVFLKREDAHELGAFKWRGALPVLERYRDGGATGVVTASTGNHGAATAWAAARAGL